jgi:hypothetical protein
MKLSIHTHALASSPSAKVPGILFQKEVGWDSLPVWALWERDVGNSTTIPWKSCLYPSKYTTWFIPSSKAALSLEIVMTRLN